MDFLDFLTRKRFRRTETVRIDVENFSDMTTRLFKGGLFPSVIFRGKTKRLDYILHLALNHPELLVELKKRFKEIK